VSASAMLAATTSARKRSAASADPLTSITPKRFMPVSFFQNFPVSLLRANFSCWLFAVGVDRVEHPRDFVFDQLHAKTELELGFGHLHTFAIHGDVVAVR